MKIVLRQNVASLGETGHIVRVNPGYARNYLFPKGLAVPATAENLKVVAAEADRDAKKLEKTKAGLEEKARSLAGVTVNAAVQVGEEEKVFGSVTSQNIADLLREQGFDFSHHDIALDKPLKALGEYDVAVKLGHAVTGTIKVWVVRE